VTEQTGPNPVPPTPIPTPHQVGRLKYFWANEIVPDVDSPGLIDGVLETKGMTVMYGRSGAGKTTVAVDLACRVASGLPWRSFHVAQGPVIYVAAENAESTNRHIWGWRHRWKPEQLPLAIMQSTFTLNPKGVKELAELIKVVQEQAGQGVRLVVLDTLARTMEGDENLAVDMNPYVDGVDELKAIINGHVLVIHHTGKDLARGARGSSVLKAATDHELEVSKEPAARIGAIKLTKVRDGELEGERFGFELMVRQIRPNSVGRMVSTTVVEEADAPAKEEKASKGGTDKAQIQDVIEAEGRMTERELHSKLRLREYDTTNRGAWKRAKEKGAYAVDEFGYVSVP
jgi:hypothetical protein